MGTMNKLRENTGVILWILVISFGVIWTLQDSGGLDAIGMQQDRNVAYVDGGPVPYEEYRDIVRQQQQQVREQMGELSADMREMIREQAFEAAVNQKIMRQEMERMGITVSDAEVEEMIFGDNPDPLIRQQFGDEEGNIDYQMIRNLAQNPQAQEAFMQIEDYLRDTRREQKLSSLIAATIHVSEEDIREEHWRRHAEAEVSYVAQRYADIPDEEVEVTEDDLRSYYEENQDDFVRPRTYTVEYVTRPIEPSEEDTLSVFDDLERVVSRFAETDDINDFLEARDSETSYTEEFQSVRDLDPALASVIYPDPTPGDVVGPAAADEMGQLIRIMDRQPAAETMLHARHILIDPDQEDDATELAEELISRIEAGEDFGALAREFSADDATARDGGDLGWFGSGELDNATIEQAAFNAAPGDVLGPIESAEGIHVVEVANRATHEVDIASLAFAIEPGGATIRDIEVELDDLAFYAEETGDFRAEAEQLGLSVEQTNIQEDQDNVPGLGNARFFNHFLDDAEAGDLSDVIEFEDQLAVLHVTDVQEEDFRPLEEVRAEIEPRVTLQKKRSFLSQRMRDAFDGDLESVAEALGASVQTMSNLTYDTETISGLGSEPRFAGAAFALDEGETSSVIEGGNGAFIVRADSFVEPPELTDEVRQELREELLQQRRMEISQDWIASLRDQADIQDNRAQFE